MINLNKKEDNKSIRNIFLLIFFAIGSYIFFESYKYYEEKKEKNKVLEEQTKEYNNQIIEQEKIKTEKLKIESGSYTNISNENYKNSSNQNYNNYYKNFKISTEIISKDYNYGINVIIRNLEKIKSREKDNNYQIEIVGYISDYGNLSYIISKRKPSNEYDKEIYEVMEEMKKIKYEENKGNMNFKIYIDNNSYNLN